MYIVRDYYQNGHVGIHVLYKPISEIKKSFDILMKIRNGLKYEIYETTQKTLQADWKELNVHH